MLWILVIVLLLLAVGGLPTLGVAPTDWGYYPSGGLGLVLLILVVLLLVRRV